MNQTVTKRKPTPVARSPFASLFSSGLFSRRLFDDFLEQYLTESNGDFKQMMNVSMDVAETDQAFEITADLPGLKAEDIDLQIDNNTLTIRGQRQEETEKQDEEKQFHRIERFSGSFSRSVTLPTAISEDETAAEFKDGVLWIIVPKTDDARPRKINISS